MTAIYLAGAIASFLAFSALAFFCTILARRNPEISWGYWLASLVLALHALGIAIGAAELIP